MSLTPAPASISQILVRISRTVASYCWSRDCVWLMVVSGCHVFFTFGGREAVHVVSLHVTHGHPHVLFELILPVLLLVIGPHWWLELRLISHV